MIKTVTLNPALDKTILLDQLTVNSVNRVRSLHQDPGGKGINVSKMIRNLGGQSIALGALGGTTGFFIKNSLTEMGIRHHFVDTGSDTRTNTKIVDLKNATYTDINEQGSPLGEHILSEIEACIFEGAHNGDILVLSGSVPAETPKEIYADYIRKAKKLGIRTIVDADGDLLKKSIEAGPYAIKPNRSELEELLKTQFGHWTDIQSAVRPLWAYGIEWIVVSLGPDGALLLTKDAGFKAEALPVHVKSTTGAGDSMVGALAVALERQLPVQKILSLCIAAGSASIMNDGTEMGRMEDVQKLLPLVSSALIKQPE